MIADYCAYAAELAEDGILNDPDDETIILAVMDRWPDHPTPWEAISRIVAAYDKAADNPIKEHAWTST